MVGKNEQKLDTLATLANAAELATGVIMRVAGNAISNQIAGETVTPELLDSIVAARLQKHFVPAVGA